MNNKHAAQSDILFRLSNKLGIPEKDLELLYFDNSGVPSAYKYKPTGEWSFMPKEKGLAK